MTRKKTSKRNCCKECGIALCKQNRGKPRATGYCRKHVWKLRK